MPSPTQTPTVQPAPTRAPVVAPEERPTATPGDGDHDRFAHYVARRELERARRTGRPVTALCGKRWVPDADPSRYPVCPTCAEIAADRLLGDVGG
jgi:hypothetical protein